MTPRARLARNVFEIALDTIAFVLCAAVLAAFAGWLRVIFFGLYFGIGAWWWRRGRRSRVPVRIARGLVFVGLTACRLVFVIEAALLASLLAWSVLATYWIAAILVTVGAALTSRRAAGGPRVPAMLAVGILIAGCWRGWGEGRASLSCAERATVLSQPGVELVASTLDGDCTGRRVALGRLPQKLVEGPGAGGRAGRLFFTTAPVSAAASPFGGSICEVDGAVRCLGDGSGYGLALDPDSAALYAPASGRFEDALSVLYTVSTRDTFEIRRTLPMRVDATGVFVDSAATQAGFFSDALRGDAWMLRVRLPDFRPLRAEYVISIPGDVRYDARAHEGVVCPATASVEGRFPLTLASVFSPEPFSIRGIGASPLAAFSWSGGCDWDRARRTVFAAVPGLGLLAEIDVPTGVVRRTHFVGIGARAVLLDEDRGRVLVGNYFSGKTRALDVGTFAERERWSLGRFLSDLRLSKDGHSLLAASSVGILRIALD